MIHDRRRGDEAGEVSQAEDGQGEEARPGRQIRWTLNIAAIRYYEEVDTDKSRCFVM